MLRPDLFPDQPDLPEVRHPILHEMSKRDAGAILRHGASVRGHGPVGPFLLTAPRATSLAVLPSRPWSRAPFHTSAILAARPSGVRWAGARSEACKGRTHHGYKQVP